MPKLIEILKKNNNTCLFISPHLDDAVLSCGSLITDLAKSSRVIVVTVFTRSYPGPQTLSIKKFLKLCGFSNAKELYSTRRKEDKKVLEMLKAGSIHLNFVDALWRKKKNPNKLEKIFGRFIPEFLFRYPVYRIHINSGRIVREDNDVIKSLERKLKKIITENSVGTVFCPLGLGKNVDHVLTRKVVEKVAENLVYWSDYPYNLTLNPNKHELKKNNLQRLTHRTKFKQKKELIKGYKTQLPPLFPSGKITSKGESFFRRNG